jgi:preprotein translocase subunit SecF
VIGLLTILGFSLYDTVVVFDKVDENTKGLASGARMTWGEAANLAVNQTLMRSINTSVIALLPVAGLLFVGAGLLGVGTLKDLALVLFVGLAAGTYSSIFLATPIVADLKEREPEQAQLRKRVLARRASAARQAAARAEGARVAVASARRAGGNATKRSAAVAVAERDELPGRVEADVVIESPGSVRPEPGSGGTTAPRPGARPQRPGNRRPSGKKRR